MTQITHSLSALQTRHTYVLCSSCVHCIILVTVSSRGVLGEDFNILLFHPKSCANTNASLPLNDTTYLPLLILYRHSLVPRPPVFFQCCIFLEFSACDREKQSYNYRLVPKPSHSFHSCTFSSHNIEKTHTQVCEGNEAILVLPNSLVIICTLSHLLDAVWEIHS